MASIHMTISLHSEVSKIISCPWVEGKAGPDAFDCYGVFEYVYKLMHGVEAPKFDFNRDDTSLVSACMEIQKDSGAWIKKDNPIEGDAVLMYKKGRPTHFGVYIAGQFLHSIKESEGVKGGVCLHSSQIINKMFEKIEFYRPL